VRMPAFGLDGPWRDRGGFAMTVEQNSGLAWLTGFPDDGPLVPRGVCDVLGGLHAIVALLAALEHRRETGEGLLVESPLAESALNIAAEQTIEWSANGVLLTRTGNRSGFAAPQGVYPCADEDRYVVLSVETETHWAGLKDALGHPAWANDARLGAAAAGQLRMSELADVIVVSRSGLTYQITQLEKAGLVRREKCPSDERGILAVLTSTGRDALDRAAPGHLRVVRKNLIDALTPAQREALAEGLTAARARLRPGR